MIRVAFKRKDGNKEPVFILTLPLKYEKWQYNYLNKVFGVAHTVKNNLISECKGDLAQMEQTKAYRYNQKLLDFKYEALKNLNIRMSKCKSAKKLIKLQTQYDKLKSEIAKLLEIKKGYAKKYRLTASDIEQRVKKHQKHYSRILHTHLAQKIAYEVSTMIDAYLFNRGKSIDFESWNECRSISGKSNKTGIIFDGQNVFVGYRKKLKLDVAFNKKDPYGYQTEALKRDVHFCRIIRKPASDGWRYFVQLTLSGMPPVKASKKTGELLHAPGNSRVGIDIGPQTAAVVSDTDVKMHVLASDVQTIDNKLRKVNRRMDRSRRATNPQFFAEDGSVVPKNKLAPELLNKQGNRKWVKSKTYRKLERKRMYLYSKQAEARIQSHNELANKIICQGTTIFIENMNFRGLAKRAKETTKNKNGKFNCKKRFGKSIANKAPAKFVSIVERKAAINGGALIKIHTSEAKASQYVHDSKTFKKKKLSQRWQVMDDGTKIQRDLYSAFLIKNTDDTLSAFNQTQLEKEYPQFLKMHSVEIERLSQLSTLPTSVGVKHTA